MKLIIFFLAITSLASCTKKINYDVKTLNLAVKMDVKGMDPISAGDKYSSNEVARIYEGLLEYHYLKRPYELQGNLAESLPQVSKNGLTYTFKIRKGVLFHDDKAFPNGIGRELVAQDFVYATKRLADPKLQGLGWWLLDGRIKGLNEWRKENSKKKKTDYDEEIEGLRALDKYTLQFKLVKPYPQFLYSLAMPYTFVVAREVVEYYGKDFLNHPVGTGAFILPEFTQTRKIIYHRNPKFRDKFYPTEGTEEFVKRGYLKDAGKKLPLVDKIIVKVVIESQPRWLSFMKGRFDYIAIPKDNHDSAISPNKKITDYLKKRDMEVMIIPSLDLTYNSFNHDMKLFQNVKLRQAMSLAYDVKKANELFYNNMTYLAQSIVPVGIAGNIEGWENPYAKYDLVKAKKLLAEAGYPGGKGLPVITFDSPASTVSRQMAEFFVKQMKKIGIEMTAHSSPWPEFQDKIRKRKTMMWGIAWGADYPDAENFLQLLYGPNRSPGPNGGGFNNKWFNEMYEKASVMQHSPERTELYEELTKFAGEQVPIIYGFHRLLLRLRNSWLENFVPTDFESNQEIYLNINNELKKKTIEEKL